MSTHSEHYTVEKASSRLSETVDSVARAQGRVAITRDGQPIAVIMSFDELKTIDEETLAWMNAGGISAYQDSRAQFAAGDTTVCTRSERCACDHGGMPKKPGKDTSDRNWRQFGIVPEADYPAAIADDLIHRIEESLAELKRVRVVSSVAPDTYVPLALEQMGRIRDAAASHARLLVEMASDVLPELTAYRMGKALGVAHTTLARWMREERATVATTAAYEHERAGRPADDAG